MKLIDHDGRTCFTYAKGANALALLKKSQNTPHHVNVETTQALVELLISLGCTDPAPLSLTSSTGTLSRRRETIGGGPFEKLPSSVI